MKMRRVMTTQMMMNYTVWYTGYNAACWLYFEANIKSRGIAFYVKPLKYINKCEKYFDFLKKKPFDKEQGRIKVPCGPNCLLNFKIDLKLWYLGKFKFQDDVYRIICHNHQWKWQKLPQIWANLVFLLIFLHTFYFGKHRANVYLCITFISSFFPADVGIETIKVWSSNICFEFVNNWQK